VRTSTARSRGCQRPRRVGFLDDGDAALQQVDGHAGDLAGQDVVGPALGQQALAVPARAEVVVVTRQEADLQGGPAGRVDQPVVVVRRDAVVGDVGRAEGIVDPNRVLHASTKDRSLRWLVCRVCVSGRLSRAAT
jgi:hypothetical protein